MDSEFLVLGRIVFSEDPGKEITRIRRELCLKQVELAKELGITNSVLSDYETGRRPAIGLHWLKRFVETVIELKIEIEARKD